MKIDKSLARLMSPCPLFLDINKIKNQKGLGTTYTIEKQRIIDTTTNNYMPIRWKTQKKQIIRKKSPKNEPEIENMNRSIIRTETAI